MSAQIPRMSDEMVDAQRKPTKRWFRYLEEMVQQAAGAVSSLGSGKIWIGSAANLPAAQTLSGDATVSVAGALTFATVNGNVGTFGSSTQVPQVTLNAKGLVTAAANVAISATAPAVTVANEATDISCFPVFVTAATGDLPPKSNALLVFDSSNGNLGAGTIYSTAGGTPTGATSVAALFTTANQPRVVWVDSTRTINNRIIEAVWLAGTWALRTVNDAYAAATNIIAVVAGHGAGTTSVTITSPTTVITSGTMTWTTPTHSSTHTFSGLITAVLGARATGGVGPTATTSQAMLATFSGEGTLALVNSGGSANNRIADFNKTTTGVSGRFVNDAYGAVVNWVTVVGGHAAGVTSITFPLLSVTGAANFDGAMTLGNAAADTITVTGTPAGQVIGSTYTPTRSAEANLDANVTMSQAQYMRAGATVAVSGTFTADPALTATATSFELSLPVASNIGAIEDVAGVAFCGAIAGMGAQITGVVANDTAKVTWISSDITSQTWSYSFVYQIL